jgi:hypothetical protein
VLSFVCLAFYIRGKEPIFKYRWNLAKQSFATNKLPIAISLLAFFICGGFVYYNTEILNTYDSSKEQENKQVEYEKKYKKYENLNQPRFYKFNYAIDIMPEDRSMTANIEAWAKNKSNTPISELHFTMPLSVDSIQIRIPGSQLKQKDKRLLSTN